MKKLFIILFFAPLFLQAQTRFYLTTATPSVTPAANAGWNVTTGNAVTLMHPYSDRSIIGSLTSGQVGAAAVRKVLIRQFISVPLIAQTLNGTFTGQVRLLMNSVTSRTGEGWVYLRLVNPNGTIGTEIGSLTTTALTTTLTNRTLIALTLSSVSVTAGQRLAIDFGWNYSTGVNTTTTAQTNITAATTTDLPVDNTQTGAGRTWVEFSQTILFQYPTGFF